MARYRLRADTTEAIRWIGEANCADVFTLLGWGHTDHSESGLDHTQIHGLGVDGKQTAHPGDWLVRAPNGWFFVLTDTAFNQRYEEI